MGKYGKVKILRTWANSGNPAAGTGHLGQIDTSLYPILVPAYDHNSQISASYWKTNFGQRPLAYTPPAGFTPLNYTVYG